MPIWKKKKLSALTCNANIQFEISKQLQEQQAQL